MVKFKIRNALLILSEQFCLLFCYNFKVNGFNQNQPNSISGCLISFEFVFLLSENQTTYALNFAVHFLQLTYNMNTKFQVRTMITFLWKKEIMTENQAMSKVHIIRLISVKSVQLYSNFKPYLKEVLFKFYNFFLNFRERALQLHRSTATSVNLIFYIFLQMAPFIVQLAGTSFSWTSLGDGARIFQDRHCLHGRSPCW